MGVNALVVGFAVEEGKGSFLEAWRYSAKQEVAPQVSDLAGFLRPEPQDASFGT